MSHVSSYKKVRGGAKAAGGHVGRPSVGWAVPGILFFALFAIVPLAIAVYLSFCHWDGLNSPTPIGLDNWTRLFKDPEFRQAAWLSLLLTSVSWVFQTPVALLLGVWAAGRQRSRAVLSAVFFIPLLLSTTAIAMLFHALLDPNFGVIKKIGPWFGIDPNIMGSSTGALLTVAFVGGWQFMPFHTLIYQGGTRQIPQVLYQAAEIDGAGMLRQFFHITLPQLRHTITTSSVLMIVGSLTYFDTVLIMTRGGPGTDTTVLPYLMYRTGFQTYDLGYAAAIATALVVVATALSLVLVRFSGFGNMRSTREGM
ncbi:MULTISPECIES: carbohydrate ABC transporter permease [unclassified Streptomyces]|uniref:carbohydrate ABC transporter permease n=1 Tax=unclassified Streptomyces TaxID=2593676 RepID=UPI00225BBD89|nr:MULTISPECIES: sugar ABC transporter permease [unclassified Streptomyces]MCX5138544.1 sugar ABC transporter permease [Streptomyces sp. NBC_00338]WRZ63220.1 sugar ABC transporter permease [Streptomyces sp. NBC_01257]WSU57195.1 sugar ABC transporter permease [Streptomyces sp. NBC_01104]